MIENAQDIPIEVRPYLYEIAKRLRSGHAAVMVGAGFSKNAIKSDATKPDIPNWNQLGNIFYEKIYQTPPPSDYHYLNILKLAEEVQAAFGRPVLDHLLRTSIQDKDFEPSQLHTELLELPWCDVFTTNYDTLLERSCESVVTQKFDIVINQEDLMYAQRPRIIKLHGSFPSERPLIVTEDDYRRYPKLFAPFVNTVQQSLLENTLCLIGFSGDDPNFLQWIGWIHDNLGKENSPKIFLIGLLSLSGAQRRLLESKNIIIVDLSLCKDVDGSPAKALSIFFNFLKNEGQKDGNLEWPGKSNYYKNKSTDLEAIIDEWRQKRLSYPNWIILPEEQRTTLWLYTEGFSRDESVFKSLPLYKDLQYSYELNWRLERCLFPVYNNIAPCFKAVLDRYNPFVKELPNAPGEDLSSAPIDLYDFRKAWIEISLGLLRFYREEEYAKEWDEIETCLRCIENNLNPEHLARFYYEKTLKSIFNFDYKKAEELLKSWPINEYLPFWEVKKAGLLAEIGEAEEAEKIIERSLLTIRKRQNLSPIINDYTWVSQEAYTMFLHRIVFYNIPGAIKFPFQFPKGDNYHQRWTTLTQYKCDPWAEKKHFDLFLQGSYTPKLPKKTNTSFDIGRSSVTYHLNPGDEDSFTAYTFFRFVEEAGIPLGIKNSKFDIKTVQGALERINSNSWYWAMSVMERYGDEKLMNIVLGRDVINNFTVDDADRMVIKYLEGFDEILSDKQNPLAITKIKMGPEYLSRLSVKNSEEVKIRLYEFIQHIYKEKIRIHDIDKLLKRLIAASSWDLQYKMIPVLIDIPLFDDGSHEIQIYFKEPSFFIRLFNYVPKVSIQVKQSLITRIIEEANENESIRTSAISRLFLLYKLKLLQSTQADELFKLIWMNIDPQTGFPQKTMLYKYAFLSLPCPKEIKPETLFKKYILEGSFEIQSLKEDKAIAMGANPIFEQEILGGSATVFNQNGIVWTEEEILIIWDNCKLWWESDKHFLKNPVYKEYGFGPSVYDEFQRRFGNLVKIISNVFGCQKHVITNKAILNQIKEVIEDMGIHEIPTMEAKAAFSEYFYSNSSDYIKDLEQIMMSESNSELIDALDSTIIIAEYANDFQNEEFIVELLDTICQPIKWKVKGVIEYSINAIVRFIRYKQNINLDRTFVTLLTVLEKFYLVTKIDYVNDLSVEEKLIYRKNAIKIASVMFTYYKKQHLEVPSIILDWQNISLDNNEFSDVANQWTMASF